MKFFSIIFSNEIIEITKNFTTNGIQDMFAYAKLYDGRKAMKLKKSNGVSKSMISTLKFPIGPLSFTCSMFLLLNVSFFRISYEIGNLKKNIVEVRIREF